MASGPPICATLRLATLESQQPESQCAMRIGHPGRRWDEVTVHSGGSARFSRVPAVTFESESSTSTSSSRFSRERRGIRMYRPYPRMVQRFCAKRLKTFDNRGDARPPISKSHPRMAQSSAGCALGDPYTLAQFPCITAATSSSRYPRAASIAGIR